MKILACVVLASSAILAGPCQASGPDYGAALQAIAREIETLKGEYPQLSGYSAIQNTDLDRLRIDYSFHTHQAPRTGGWSSGVPNPDGDGIWFLIDFHAPDSKLEMHRQPIVSTVARLGDKVVYMLILEGDQAKPVAGRIWAIIRRQIEAAAGQEHGDPPVREAPASSAPQKPRRLEPSTW